MCLDDGPANCESHAHAVWLGSKERVEHALEMRRIESLARISHRDAHVTCVIPIGTNGQLAHAVFTLCDRFQAVDDQIQYYLLQLHTISMDERQVVLQLALQRHMAALCLALR